MSKKRYLLIGIVFASVFVMTILLTYQERIDAWECRLVRLHGDPARADRIQIEPKNLWIEKGTCVIWFNKARTQTPEVMIKFRDGKRCQEITDAPAGFSYDAIKDCYVTGLITIGGTSSLRFSEKGTYEYEVTGAGKETAKGKIVVKE